ncbi:hypothetical protein DFP72DRAFT_842614 [Ephemerocybe angulata]|uniref:Uncharacterized protein n=1 Tax=Ephemerocybe angulata TaxID=980116 RepID=A0A8H6MDD7_9AGAR|nr:hypothetical protein DFP72DRAFT_842614 [Tulosesus angulatus]
MVLLERVAAKVEGVEGFYTCGGGDGGEERRGVLEEGFFVGKAEAEGWNRDVLYDADPDLIWELQAFPLGEGWIEEIHRCIKGELNPRRVEINRLVPREEEYNGNDPVPSCLSRKAAAANVAPLRSDLDTNDLHTHRLPSDVFKLPVTIFDSPSSRAGRGWYMPQSPMSVETGGQRAVISNAIDAKLPRACTLASRRLASTEVVMIEDKPWNEWDMAWKSYIRKDGKD